MRCCCFCWRRGGRVDTDKPCLRLKRRHCLRTPLIQGAHVAAGARGADRTLLRRFSRVYGPVGPVSIGGALHVQAILSEVQ